MVVVLRFTTETEKKGGGGVYRSSETPLPYTAVPTATPSSWLAGSSRERRRQWSLVGLFCEEGDFMFVYVWIEWGERQT
ncbi:hypothetical protein Hanom_Chr08g00684021 [Helianthus anomalus]